MRNQFKWSHQCKYVHTWQNHRTWTLPYFYLLSKTPMKCCISMHIHNEIIRSGCWLGGFLLSKAPMKCPICMYIAENAKFQYIDSSSHVQSICSVQNFWMQSKIFEHHQKSLDGSKKFGCGVKLLEKERISKKRYVPNFWTHPKFIWTPPKFFNTSKIFWTCSKIFGRSRWIGH